jgi:hypothetical protein
MLAKVIRNLIYHFWLKPYGWIKSLFNHRKASSIYLFAMGRGGSTILMESLNHGVSKSTLFWEPLAGGCVKLPHLKKMNFYLQPYLPKKEEDKKIFQVFQKLLNGDYLDLSLVYNTPSLVQIPFNSCNIFKFCRGNLLIPYLVEKFSIKPVVLMRSPYAIIKSQINHPAYSELYVDASFKVPQNTPYYDFYNQYEWIFNSINTIEEHLAIKWALNATILNHPVTKDCLVLFYENLVDNPKAELQKIMNFTAVEINIEQAIKAFNTTSLSGSSGNKRALTETQICNITNVLKKFELDHVYSKEDRPLSFTRNLS